MSGFYPGAEKYTLERSLERNRDILSESDVRLITRYVDEKEDTDHISPARRRKIGFMLIMFRRFIRKPYEELEIEDVLAGVRAFKNGKTKPINNRPPKPYGKNTINDGVTILKGFLVWMSREKITNIQRTDIYERVKAPKGKDITEVLDPSEILQEEEIFQLARSTRSERDRSLILVLYETGARPGEVSTLTWRDAVFEPIGEALTVKMHITDHKKSKKRYARLTVSAPALLQLKNLVKPMSELEPIFRMDDGAPISHTAMTRVLQRAALEARITKPVRPHCFRHARATNLVKTGYNESVIKKQLWNNLDTKMFKVYVALGEDAIDAEVFKHTGIRTIINDKKKENPLAPVICPHCHTSNSCDDDFCGKCARPISEAKLQELTQAEDDVDQDQRFKKWMDKVHAEAKEEFKKMMISRT